MFKILIHTSFALDLHSFDGVLEEDSIKENAMVNVTIRLDGKDKDEFTRICEKIGLSVSVR